MIAIALASTTLAFSYQGAPIAQPVSPWEGQVQSLICKTVSDEQGSEEYVMTLTETHGFIVGQKPEQAISMREFVSLEVVPTVARGQASIRRLKFKADDQTVFVSQLYQSDKLISTFLSVGANANDDRDLPFETLAGFCTSATIESEAAA